MIVYTCFDGEVVNPLESALLCGVSSEATVPPISLELYNNTGNGVTGYHYDPVFAAQRQRRSQLRLKASTSSRITPAMQEERKDTTASNMCETCHQHFATCNIINKL